MDTEIIDIDDPGLISINKITERIIKCAFAVSNSLGVGFLEKVYENAMAVELQSEGLRFSKQHPLPVFYRNTQVGEYFADFFS